jgi:DNA-binding NarL/FixJ family response regulator
VDRVLLCDDAVAYGTLFARWMRDGDVAEVTQARTAAEALELIPELRPRAIVLDHLLPDGTSKELLPRLRERAPDTRILLISGLPDDKLAEAAAQSGADAHIGKWSGTGEMRDAVRGLLA